MYSVGKPNEQSSTLLQCEPRPGLANPHHALQASAVEYRVRESAVANEGSKGTQSISPVGPRLAPWSQHRRCLGTRRVACWAAQRSRCTKPLPPCTTHAPEGKRAPPTRSLRSSVRLQLGGG